MDNLTKMMSKLSFNDKTHDEDVETVEKMFNKMSLNTTDEHMESLIDQMQTLTIKDDECEIVMKDKTVIKIFLPCYIQSYYPMETMHMVNCC